MNDIIELKGGTKYVVDKNGTYVNVEKRKKKLEKQMQDYQKKIESLVKK